MTFLGNDAEFVELRLPDLAGGRVVLSWAARSHIGMRRRVNEDSVITMPPVFAVADGMGGHAAGDLASAAVVSRLADAVDIGRIRNVTELDRTLLLASDEIDEISHRLSAGAGTTVTGILLTWVEQQPAFLVFNIGDSRVYGLTGRGLSRITVDHSVVQGLIDAGELTPEEAEEHPDANVITRSLGFGDSPAPDLWGVRLCAGLRMLVCSDGLTKEVPDAEIERMLASPLSAAAVSDLLLDAALDSGGRDNVSFIVIDVHELRGLEAAPSMLSRSGAPADADASSTASPDSELDPNDPAGEGLDRDVVAPA